MGGYLVMVYSLHDIVGLTFATWRFFEQSDGDDDDFWPDVKSERQYLTLLNDCITYVRN